MRGIGGGRLPPASQHCARAIQWFRRQIGDWGWGRGGEERGVRAGSFIHSLQLLLSSIPSVFIQLWTWSDVEQSSPRQQTVNMVPALSPQYILLILANIKVTISRNIEDILLEEAAHPNSVFSQFSKHSSSSHSSNNIRTFFQTGVSIFKLFISSVFS